MTHITDVAHGGATTDTAECGRYTPRCGTGRSPASHGVLVTTSWYGKASTDFATRNGRIHLIDGRNLKSLLLDYLGSDVLIGLPKLPPGWNPSHVT